MSARVVSGVTAEEMAIVAHMYHQHCKETGETFPLRWLGGHLWCIDRYEHTPEAIARNKERMAEWAERERQRELAMIYHKAEA